MKQIVFKYRKNSNDLNFRRIQNNDFSVQYFKVSDTSSCEIKTIVLYYSSGEADFHFKSILSG